MNKSIKFMLMLLVVAGITTLTSCQKDKIGVYSPKKKVQQMYYSSGYYDKAPFMHMEWNGDKLNSITHYMDYGFKGETWMEQFTYDGNRVIRVDNYTNSEYITYEYDGKHLKSATVYYRNAIVCTWAVTYDGDNIGKLTGTFYDSYNSDGTMLHLNPLSHLLPLNVCEAVVKQEQQMAKQQRQKDTYTLVLLLTWTDNNLSKLVFTGEGDYIDMQLQYDDKNCPFYGFMGCLEDYLVNFLEGHTGFTKHNVTSVILTEGHDVDTICYAYQYDSDDCPILQTLYYADDPDDKTVLYFEY